MKVFTNMANLTESRFSLDYFCFRGRMFDTLNLGTLQTVNEIIKVPDIIIGYFSHILQIVY